MEDSNLGAPRWRRICGRYHPHRRSEDQVWHRSFQRLPIAQMHNGMLLYSAPKLDADMPVCATLFLGDRLQIEGAVHTSVGPCVKDILKNEGAPALFKGVGPRMSIIGPL